MSAIVKGELPLGVPVRCFRFARALTLGRYSPAWPALCLIVCLILSASSLRAQAFEPSFTVGAGIQTDYQHNEADATADDQFALGHARIYLGGDITPNISAMFNTDYSATSPFDAVQILDAVAEFHTKSPMFNVWFGRFLPPSDRDNFTGPFYANEWYMYQPTASRTDIPPSTKAATTASRIGATSRLVPGQDKSIGRRLRRQLRGRG
jgi:hypothetical protein